MRKLDQNDKRFIRYAATGIGTYIAIFVVVILYLGVERFEGLPAVMLGLMNYAIFSVIGAAAHQLSRRPIVED